MWSYYGAKTNVIRLYPPPKENKIIEPFAGTARYALEYWEKDVLICDKYKVIIDIWKWLQKCSPADVLSLPRFKAGENINKYPYDCEEQRLLCGFLCGFGFYSPRQTATPRMRNRPNAMNYTIKKIAASLFKIRHWEIMEGTYEDIPNQRASWFIDPPYQHGGKYYVESGSKINFTSLATWCQSREGQVIVCENGKADWMEFKPLAIQQTLMGKNSEMIWSNLPTGADNLQIKMF
jgi:site-specific DNA-adenine methylase